MSDQKIAGGLNSTIVELTPPRKSHKSKGIGRGKGPRRKSSCSNIALAKMRGISEAKVRRCFAMADALGSDLERIVGTSLSTPREMKALAALPEPEREAIIARAQKGEKVKVYVKKSDAEKCKWAYANYLNAVYRLTPSGIAEFEDWKRAINAELSA